MDAFVKGSRPNLYFFDMLRNCKQPKSKWEEVYPFNGLK